MKRVELGAFTGGGFGLRISRPGQDVANPAAALMFDSDRRVLSRVDGGVVQANVVSRVVTNTNPPFGLPGITTTRWEHQSVFIFQEPLPFNPIVRVGYTVFINGTSYTYDDYSRSGTRYTSTTSSVTVNVSHAAPGDVNYDAAPIHRIAVLNSARF
jgi:hypothetical protein